MNKNRIAALLAAGMIFANAGAAAQLPPEENMKAAAVQIRTAASRFWISLLS